MYEHEPWLTELLINTSDLERARTADTPGRNPITIKNDGQRETQKDGDDARGASAAATHAHR